MEWKLNERELFGCTGIKREADWCRSMRSQADFEKRVDPNNKEQMSLLDEMRKHTEKV